MDNNIVNGTTTEGDDNDNGASSPSPLTDGATTIDQIPLFNMTMSHITIDQKLKDALENALVNAQPGLNYYPIGPGPGSGGPPPPKKSTNTLTFKDCGGLESQISYLKTAVIETRSENNAVKKRYSLEPPKGILFYGPPGTGKTRLAQALCNELKTQSGRPFHFIYRKGLFCASKLFGQSSENLRRVFEEAKQQRPCLIFFDEIDGLCPNRNVAHQATVTVITTLLTLMDELPKGDVFVVAATNRLEAIDVALRRPGRFDKHLEFTLPTETARLKILQIHTEKYKEKPTLELLRKLSKETVGYTGADLAKLALDAFDQALARFTKDMNNIHSAKFDDFKGLSVTEKDWLAARKRMKPSNSAIFGSSLYTPPPPVGTHITPLTRHHVERITDKLLEQLPEEKGCTFSEQPIIKSLHVFIRTQSVLAELDDYIIADVFRTPKLQKYSVYTISCSTLTANPGKDWAARIQETFTQALNAPTSSILYVKQIDDVVELLKAARLEVAINIKHQLERLRGKSVLLLTSGYVHPHHLPLDNPFKKLLVSSSAIYEVTPPTNDERQRFFEPVFSEVQSSNSGWPKKTALDFDKAKESAITSTKGKHLGSVILLHDWLRQRWLKCKREMAQKQTVNVVEIFLQTIGQYRLHK